jgi:glycosyltransferase 2 family protein
MKRPIAAGIILVIAFIILYTVIVSLGNVSLFFESIKSTDILLFSIGLCIILISNACGALRWSALIKEVGAQNSRIFSHAFGMFSLGQAAGLVVPSRIGNYTKVPMVMKLDQLSYEKGFSAVNAETLIDLIYICAAGIVSLIIMSAFLLTSHFLLVLLLVGLIGILSVTLFIFYHIEHFQYYYEKSLKYTEKNNHSILIRVPAKLLVKLYDLILSTRKIFSHKELLVQLIVFALLFHLLAIAGYFLVIKSAHVSLSILVIFAIVTITFLVGIISLIPGGLGASDLSLIALLASQGVPLPVATNIALLFRIAMYLPILLVIGIYGIQKKFWIKHA